MKSPPNFQHTPVTVLFCRKDSVYKRFPHVQIYDRERDALSWPADTPVIAHPPCAQWGQLSHMANKNLPEKALAPWAVEQIRSCGGILDHPAQSKLWPTMGLPEPGDSDSFGGWTLMILQHWFDHLAAKATRLYIVGISPETLPPIPISLNEPTHVISTSGRQRDGSRKTHKIRLHQGNRDRTPLAFAVWLLAVAAAMPSPKISSAS